MGYTDRLTLTFERSIALATDVAQADFLERYAAILDELNAYRATWSLINFKGVFDRMVARGLLTVEVVNGVPHYEGTDKMTDDVVVILRRMHDDKLELDAALERVDG